MNVTFNVSGSPILDIYNDTSYDGGDWPTDTVFPLLKQPIHMVAIYTIAYTLIFLFALVGNSLVITVVCRNPRMHSVTNYFIVNLAIADILVSLLCIPISLLMNLFTGKIYTCTACAFVYMYKPIPMLYSSYKEDQLTL
jgi:hypothetical protein